MESVMYKQHEIVYVEQFDYYAVTINEHGGSEGFETLEDAKAFIDSLTQDNS